MNRDLILYGGYGTFGSLVARELESGGLGLTIAGRDPDRAERFAAELGDGHRGIAADVSDADSCRAALGGHSVAVNCSGPYDEHDTTLLDACLDAGCHYVDIADGRRYVTRVREFGARFAAMGLTAAYGCSSLPSISGALALLAADGAAARPSHARVTLFIGNKNPKGEAAVRSALRVIGRPIAAPQGTLLGFRDVETVELPKPFGRRRVANFESPEYDLFPALLGVTSVAVKAGFELRPANWMFQLMALGRVKIGRFGESLLLRLGSLSSGFGTSAGVVQTELFYGQGGPPLRASLSAEQGQRMAALPCALVARALLDGDFRHFPLADARGSRVTQPMPRGAITAYEALGHRRLLDRLVASGCTLEAPSSGGADRGAVL